MAGRILVAAGTNGAGKSSIVQPLIRARGGFYVNPDETTREFIAAGMAPDQANGAAWNRHFQMLRAAIDAGTHYAFETTLGGSSIPYQMMRALAMDRDLEIFFVGLASVDLHIRRVSERVRRRGHDIPVEKIRERYDTSRERLLSFIGTRAGMRVWDNSEQTADGTPRPRLMFEIRERCLYLPSTHDQATVPEWVKPLLQRAYRFCARSPGG